MVWLSDRAVFMTTENGVVMRNLFGLTFAELPEPVPVRLIDGTV